MFYCVITININNVFAITAFHRDQIRIIILRNLKSISIGNAALLYPNVNTLFVYRFPSFHFWYIFTENLTDGLIGAFNTNLCIILPGASETMTSNSCEPNMMEKRRKRLIQFKMFLKLIFFHHCIFNLFFKM